MALGKDTLRLISNVPRELKEQLEEIAKKQNRSLSNLVTTILIQYVEDQQRRHDNTNKKNKR